MADVHHLISLGLGSPADIPHFLLLGLSVNDAVQEPTADVTVIVRARARTVVVTPDLPVVRRESPRRIVV